MDSIGATTKASQLVSPKVTKTKAAPTGSSTLPNATFGCEHVQSLFKANKALAKETYETAIQTLADPRRIKPQTYKSSSSENDTIVVSIKPTYLCLQCPSIMSADGRDKHHEARKHAFTVESRHGCLYCQFCRDFVYDPEFEKIRAQRGTKRKADDSNGIEDQRLVATHAAFVPCRATGLRGLYNMGQTCFMSVILQTIIHNPLVRNFYLSEGHSSRDCDDEYCISCAMDEIFQEFYSAEKTEGYGAVSMLLASWMAEQALVGYQQQDAHEYMQFLFNSLHQKNGGTLSEDCSCIIHKTFYGQLQSTVRCDKCKNITTALDPVMDLSLDIRDVKKRKLEPGASKAEKAEIKIDLKECLDSFTQKEKLPATDYTCQKCGGSQPATKQLSIKRLPPVVPVHLKRFEHSKANATKLETRVAFPLQLNLHPYTTRAKDANNKKSFANGFVPKASPELVYELSAVIVHKGNIDTGHYISYSREGQDWFLFDDNKAVAASEADVLEANAYLLFYMAREL
ncbi:ubiquitin carboxyl-terminal hydrolase 2 [Pseudovirgaria hyperparasitica]|uniref:Ubiquitin carboxyl-terminal hydrolase n=1 Tax=Pseudovirgaria hyperparasitica TaxID=470096 RepID=A0A6A6W6K8_9PEZI|nr:ubiquitin carboxyl-terminal hydrolase 2 [Pseudovirgaria hyperparasitica]KAF2758253.1 ubiquitin carboxyl-terminal hydrolase 2 [Pseudovirgaria hyperparasitica]